MSTALQEQLQRAVGDSYDVLREVGAGGMATVFLAHDRKHGREVALKLLDPELGAVLGVERFLAEIQVTAKLQHPNLLPLFDSGAADGLLYYVMPYVAGESLRARLDRERQLPVDDALRIAIAVASALDYAHRQGVIHRDLKPENIMLHEGQPLVADFGIALAVSKAGGSRLTQTGLSLGTPRYMSPEQAAGDRLVDARSDVYSLACVLYEMLTGDVPHTGSSVQAIIAKILTEPVQGVRAHRPSVSPDVEAVLDRALAKIPADRFQSAREFGDALAGRTVSGSVVRSHGAGRHARRIWSDPLFLAVSVLAVAALSVAVALWQRSRTAPPARTARFVVASLSEAFVSNAAAMTPDGSNIVYVGPAEKRHPLLVRSLDQLTTRVLAGTEGALGPFVSPDGRWIGFFTTDDKLKKVPLDDGTPVVLTTSWRYGSGSWGRGVIVTDTRFGSSGGLVSLPAEGGVTHLITQVDTAAGEVRHRSPVLLSDGRTVAFTVERARSGPRGPSDELALARLDNRSTAIAPHHRLGVTGRAVASVDGWLVYTDDESATLFAVRVDLARGTTTGAPIAVFQETTGTLRSVSLADDGTLLYVRSASGNAPVIVDERGAAQPLSKSGAGNFMNPRVSPDGRKIAVQSITPQTSDVWIYDIATGTPTRLTSGSSAYGVAWAREGRQVIFVTSGAAEALWRQAADGSTPAERFLDGAGIGSEVTPDGRTLLFAREQRGRWAIWTVGLTGGDRTPRPLFTEAFDANMPAISPDGRWLAYVSKPAGREEIFVRPFPGPGSAVQISSGGGTEPAWSKDGRRIFYRAERQMMSASVSFSPTPSVTARQSMFGDNFGGEMPHRNYDVLPGNRFVMIASENTAPEMVIVLNWLPELRALLAQSTSEARK